MQFDITWTITAIIAVSSFISPIAVALINNHHHAKMRKIELDHDEKLRRLDLQQQATIRQSDIYYMDKKQAFSDFINAASEFSIYKRTRDTYKELENALNRALLFCNVETRQLLLDFLSHVDSTLFSDDLSLQVRQEYNKLLTELSIRLNQELESTKPVIECK